MRVHTDKLMDMVRGLDQYEKSKDDGLRKIRAVAFMDQYSMWIDILIKERLVKEAGK